MTWSLAIAEGDELGNHMGSAYMIINDWIIAFTVMMRVYFCCPHDEPANTLRMFRRGRKCEVGSKVTPMILGVRHSVRSEPLPDDMRVCTGLVGVGGKEGGARLGDGYGEALPTGPWRTSEEWAERTVAEFATHTADAAAVKLSAYTEK